MHLNLPKNESKILLHCCCAPCSCAIIDALLEQHILPTLFFYNPNIHPQDEYERRKEELVRYAKKRGVFFVDADYEKETWFQAVSGLEKEPERGRRCTICFEMRLKKTALYASLHGFSVISTTLGISRWKDFDQVTHSGKKAVSCFPGLEYFDYYWREGSVSSRAKKISTEENFYRQTFCGCVFSQKGRT